MQLARMRAQLSATCFIALTLTLLARQWRLSGEGARSRHYTGFGEICRGPLGAALDTMMASLDHVAIMQAGGWKTVDVVARRVESSAAHNLHERRWATIARA